MTLVREIMSPHVRTVDAQQTLADAAHMMADLDVGVLPVCDADGNPIGVLTDRDIVVSCIARDGDPRTTRVGDIALCDAVGANPDDDLEDALETMQENQLRRLLVLEDGRLVGILSQRDIALAAAPEDTGRTVEAISI